MNPNFKSVLIRTKQAERIIKEALPLMPLVNAQTNPTIHTTTRALIDYALAQLEKAKENDSTN